MPGLVRRAPQTKRLRFQRGDGCRDRGDGCCYVQFVGPWRELQRFGLQSTSKPLKNIRGIHRIINSQVRSINFWSGSWMISCTWILPGLLGGHDLSLAALSKKSWHKSLTFPHSQRPDSLLDRLHLWLLIRWLGSLSLPGGSNEFLAILNSPLSNSQIPKDTQGSVATCSAKISISLWNENHGRVRKPANAMPEPETGDAKHAKHDDDPSGAWWFCAGLGSGFRPPALAGQLGALHSTELSWHTRKHQVGDRERMRPYGNTGVLFVQSFAALFSDFFWKGGFFFHVFPCQITRMDASRQGAPGVVLVLVLVELVLLELVAGSSLREPCWSEVYPGCSVLVGRWRHQNKQSRVAVRWCLKLDSNQFGTFAAEGDMYTESPATRSPVRSGRWQSKSISSRSPVHRRVPKEGKKQAKTSIYHTRGWWRVCQLVIHSNIPLTSPPVWRPTAQVKGPSSDVGGVLEIHPPAHGRVLKSYPPNDRHTQTVKDVPHIMCVCVGESVHVPCWRASS